MEAGATPTDFQKDFEAIAAKHEWAYRGDPAWRAAIILNTNLRSAYAAENGSMRSSKATRPYLRYVSVLDDRDPPAASRMARHVLPSTIPREKHTPTKRWSSHCTIMTVAHTT